MCLKYNCGLLLSGSFFFFFFFQLITETGEHWYITEEKSDLESNTGRQGNIEATQRNPVGPPFLEEKTEVNSEIVVCLNCCDGHR